MKTSLPFVALWSEVRSTGEQVLHLLNRKIHLSVSLPEIGTSSNAVEDFLPELVQVMPKGEPHTRWLLLLEPNLPAFWFSHRWESLNLAGRPLATQALVVRHAMWCNEPESDGTSALLLDLFPRDEFSFLEYFQPLIQSSQLRSCRKKFLDKIGGANDLFVMAHARAHGLVDANDVPYVLPPIHPAPRRVWLLACNVDTALDVLAKNLLKCGCKSVIAATSELSAPAMANLVDEWFRTGCTSSNVASWLANTSERQPGDGNVLSLTIWGAVDIDQTACAQWNRMTWDDIHGESRRPPLDDETSREAFHGALQQGLSPEAWALTREWMLPPLLWLAEKHHHPAMAGLSVEIGDSKSAVAIRGLAAAARRVGNYVQTAKYLSLGLGLSDISVKERAEYLGALANLFIDLDLPENAAAAIEQHEGCNLNDPKDRNDADFKRLDWMARVEARRGRLNLAVDLMTTKRKRALLDSGRELAWQLYLSVWGERAGQVSNESCAQFALQVMQQLDGVDPQDVGLGNETIAYLLRALALYAWSSKDAISTNIVAAWLSVAEHRLTDDDPGPWAYVIAYLYFQQCAPSNSFERAMSALERARYHLEAATLMGLAGQEDESRKILSRFQRRRIDSIHALNMPSVANSNDPKNESISRTQKENSTEYRFDTLARNGQMPI